MGDLQAYTQLLEFNINSRVTDIAEILLENQPKIIGLGVYIWNAAETLQLVALLKTISPETIIILGGPEVSYEYDEQLLVGHADYVIAGQGDLAFAELCTELFDNKKPLNKVIHPLPLEMSSLQLPYDYYTDEDVANRIIYVEASRGCPFKCEFCLSALDKTVYPFNLDLFLNEMDKLYQRGVRHYKFIDRTFNLKIDTSIRIMEFFLEKIEADESDPLFLHFELIPDHLPDKLKSIITRFPEGSLQFEIGIQSLNPEVQTTISRKQNTQKASANLSWIREHSHAHIHADLIIGLPGETIESFAQGLNQLYKINPHEIQIGILKRLKGTPIIRHSEIYDMRYNPLPPFTIVSNNLISYSEMQRLTRFARYWDLIINSGRFKHTKITLLARDAFKDFLTLSDWIFSISGQTHKISLERLYSLLYRGMTQALLMDEQQVTSCLLGDFELSGIKGRAKFLDHSARQVKLTKSNQRQARHINR